ncbi:redoxin domain-containing protein [soil metagenome]
MIRRSMKIILPLVLIPCLALTVYKVKAAEDAPLKKLEKLFNRLDRNADGKLSTAELPNDGWIERLDDNKDGFVTIEEAGRKIALIFQSRSAPTNLTPATLDKSITEGPVALKASDQGVGHLVADLPLTDLDGRACQLSSFKQSKAIVLAFFSATCPVSGKLGPELGRLEKELTAENITLLLVDPIATESTDEMKAFATKYSIKAPIVHDKANALTQALQTTTTTEVFVIDAARTLVYRGAISDQYGLGYQLDAPRQSYLRDAITSLLNGQPITIGATTAPGCALDVSPSKAVVANTETTYHHQISRILQNNCLECHHQDGLGPFSLETYEDVIEHAGMIKKQITRGAMPPWFAAPQADPHGSPWMNDRSLSESDKSTLLTWLDSNRPAGNIADAPVAMKYSKDWIIGQPDVVFQLPQPVSIKAEGTMPYQNVTVQTNLAEDRWIQSYEITPTDRSVVHHVIVKVINKGGTATEDEVRSEREGFWAAYVPGYSYRILPDGFAKKLPAGASIHFQIHYTPNGKATQDQLKIGLKFASKAPQYEVHVLGLANPKLNIPAGAANHVETTQQNVPVDMTLSGYLPHMHVRGKSFKYEVTYPDGSQETLLDIPRYDFNWQLQYILSKPKIIPKGSVVKTTAVFDNSANNPANPDPTKNVRWGQQTYDEMMIGYVEYFLPLSANVAAK